MGIILYLSYNQKDKTKKYLGIIISIILPTFLHTLFNTLRGYDAYPIPKSFISFYITIFEYYIMIVGLYIFKKKFGDNYEQNQN